MHNWRHVVSSFSEILATLIFVTSYLSSVTSVLWKGLFLLHCVSWADCLGTQEATKALRPHGQEPLKVFVCFVLLKASKDKKFSSFIPERSLAQFLAPSGPSPAALLFHISAYACLPACPKDSGNFSLCKAALDPCKVGAPWRGPRLLLRA